ncbi:unnamed protein product, partial [Anisakis simplex]|uniref:RYDR_ITPR domain-containing protein n=1 Tax=Anisakis simplex TaxID=6269 RepID=A0A0M3JJG3_ANISI
VGIDLRRRDCGVTAPGALSVDRLALRNNRTNLFECVLMSVIKYCNCHPLLSEFLLADMSSMGQLNKSIFEAVCSAPINVMISNDKQNISEK